MLPITIKNHPKYLVNFFLSILWLALAPNLAIKAVTGKKTKKDKKKGKATLISLLGHENTIKYANKIIFKINSKLKKYGSKSENIKGTLEYILKRDRWHKIINF